MGPKVSSLTYKRRAKWKMLRGIYSAIYGEVNVSVSVCVEIKGDYIEKQQRCFTPVIFKSCQAGNFWTHPRRKCAGSVIITSVCHKFKNNSVVLYVRCLYFPKLEWTHTHLVVKSRNINYYKRL